MVKTPSGIKNLAQVAFNFAIRRTLKPFEHAFINVRIHSVVTAVRICTLQPAPLELLIDS